MMLENFEHIQSAHCENGVVVKLLHNHGVTSLNEPMAFGIGSGLFYIHIPFLKFNNAPAVAFRTMPGAIFKRTCKLLNINYISKKFKNEQKAQQYLDDLLNQGVNVGCQVGVFNLTYLPVEYRFHFNAHNIVVYKKQNDHYMVSDTVMEQPTILSEKDMLKARFAKGIYAPKGHLYYINEAKSHEVNQTSLKRAIAKGIHRNVRDMLHIPGGIVGVDGIKYTGKQILKWREKLGIRKAGRYLGHLVRMQEEIGTGGGGFRFLYAAFLQQSADIFENDVLLKMSDNFSKSGDLWRQAAVKMAGIYKEKNSDQVHFKEIADYFMEISEVEKDTFKTLSKLKLNYRNE